MRARQHAPSPERDVCFDGFLRLHVDVVPRLAGPVSATPIPPLRIIGELETRFKKFPPIKLGTPNRIGRQSQLLRTRACTQFFLDTGLEQ